MSYSASSRAVAMTSCLMNFINLDLTNPNSPNSINLMVILFLIQFAGVDCAPRFSDNVDLDRYEWNCRGNVDPCQLNHMLNMRDFHCQSDRPISFCLMILIYDFGEGIPFEEGICRIGAHAIAKGHYLHIGRLSRLTSAF